MSQFHWIGDAVYSPNNSVAGLVHAYKNLTDNVEYQWFQERMDVIDGVWDDHDYGVNDGGRDVEDKGTRQGMFLDFLFGSGEGDVALRAQEGLYHSRTVALGEGLTAKLVFLDTRSHRGPHWLYSIGAIPLPLTALIAASVRTTYTMLGFGREHDADVLGEAQWTWLERTLSDSDADFHVIASSIQVLTTNPVVESWGHFPVARRRLLDLLRRTDPSGVVLLSGDVHHGELSSASIVRDHHHHRHDDDDNDVGAGAGARAEGNRQQALVEVTSSGLTHTCGGGRLTGLLCPAMLKQFSEHRLAPEAIFTGKNFGILQGVSPTLSGSGPAALDVSVVDLASRTTVLQHRVFAHDSHVPREPISAIRAHDLAVDVAFVGKVYAAAVTIGLVILWLLWRLLGVFRKKRSGVKTKRG